MLSQKYKSANRPALPGKAPRASLRTLARRGLFALKNPGYVATMVFLDAHGAHAQTAATVKTNAENMIQDFVDVIVAASGLYGVYLGFRAARTLVAASREGGRGDSKGHHVMADLGGAALAVSIGVVIYIVSNSLLGSSATQPTLTAPTVTPAGG